MVETSPINFNEQHIIVFDGYCNFCAWSVRFLMKFDRKNIFKFTASQNDAGKKILENFKIEEVNSILYLRTSKVLQSSTAVLYILHDLGFPWKLFFVFIIIPAFIRDFIYNLFAKLRYRVFGRREECMVPTKEEMERFL